MSFKYFLVLIAALVMSFQLIAQQAIVRGTVYDDENAEPLPFLNVVVEGTSTGSTTDLDGSYTLKLDAGTYTLVYSYLGYADKKITDVVLTEGETKLLDVRMGEASETLKEVVIVERAIRNTEAATLTLQKKSANLINVTSSETFKKLGDGDAAAAVNRVSGVSVQDGKYVFVRGLGDRYTKTILNGLDIPGLDPDRNNVQMDIFPTSLIDRIIVNKSFTPNLPGDFTGGIVDITTKDFPDSLTVNFTYGTSFNTKTHFNNDFILYDGGATDFLAFDDGTRGMPFAIKTIVPDESKNDITLNEQTAAFDPQLGVQNQNNFLDQALSFGFGNQYNKKNVDIGFNFVVNYGLSYQYLTDVVNGEYRKDPINKSNTSLERDRLSISNIGERDVAWSTLLGTSVKFKKTNRLRFNIFHSQNGNAKASEGRTINGEANPSEKQNNALLYTQRAVTNIGLSGTHSLNKLKLTWKGAATNSSINDPDLRTTDLNCEVDGASEDDSCEAGLYHLDGAVGGRIKRDFRALEEVNYTAGLDFELPLKSKSTNKPKIKFGGLYTFKERDFNIQEFAVFNNETNDFPFVPNFFFEEENIWNLDDTTGTYIRYDYLPANTFSAKQSTNAAYVMNELPVGKKFTAIYGVRAEYFTNRFTGNNPGSTPNSPLDFNDSLLLESLDILPAINLVYELVDNMNLRASYSQTLARPSFKEKSSVSIFDPIADRRYTGNIADLEITNIHNADLRWEYFFQGGEIISLGTFYKHFINPIELVAEELQPSEIKPRNTESADVLGVEFEFRKGLDFIMPSLSNFSIASNLTYVYSKVTMTDAEFESRKNEALDDETIKNTRQLFGQSPYIINANLNYLTDNNDLGVNLSYNVQGERLSVVGIGGIPDVFEQPFHSLNLRVSKSFGEVQNAKLSVGVINILGEQNVQLYKSEKAISQTYNRFEQGRTFNLGFSYSFR